MPHFNREGNPTSVLVALPRHRLSCLAASAAEGSPRKPRVYPQREVWCDREVALTAAGKRGLKKHKCGTGGVKKKLGLK
jgi:hypothetical protein